MNPLKKLAGQTAVYGLPTILGRFLQYLLVLLLTRVFSTAEYGTISVFYSYAALLTVILTYGMETAFFRFNENEENKQRVFSTGMISLALTTGIFLLLTNLFAAQIAGWIGYPGQARYVVWFAWFLGLDALSAIPFARLRAQCRPVRFAVIKFVNILSNIFITLFFILVCPALFSHDPGGLIRFVYRPDWGIEYVFIANLAASIITLLLLAPQILKVEWKLNPELWKRMLLYAFPLLFAGMAGIVNETFDRLLLRYLLPPGIAESQVGIYSACYKISILITLFVQAYRFAAEPFFFAHAKEKDAKVLYARIMDYFIIAISLVFLVTLLYLDDVFIHMVGPKFREGKGVIPVLMLANIFLGVYYNLSIWYKLTGRTRWGAYLAFFGAIITLIFNFYWIPRSAGHLIYGYIGSAWATFICYGSMMVLAYLLGQHFYPIKYNLRKFFGYTCLAVAIYLFSQWLRPDVAFIRIAFNTALLLGFAAVAFFVERKHPVAV